MAEDSSTSSAGAQVPALPPREESPAQAATEQSYDPWEDKRYFEEYGKLDIHCDMLRDMSRMSSYYSAITQNPQDFKDKVVLDVGCGTGVLACWCAKAGAKKVYAVEACSIADQAELIVQRNGLSGVVEIIRGRVENISLPEKVDVIISEWMGSFLFFESMLESVIHAREHFLKPGGKLYPSAGRLYVAPVCFDRFFDKKVHFLKNVCGVDMSPLMPFARKEFTAWGLRGRRVKSDWVIGKAQVVKHVEIATVTANELNKIVCPLKLTVSKAGKVNMHGFATWFDVSFPATPDKPPVVLCTSPDNPLTHWQQDAYLFESAIRVREGDEIRGSLKMVQNPHWRRHFDFEFSFHVRDQEHYKLFST